MRGIYIIYTILFSLVNQHSFCLLSSDTLQVILFVCFIFDLRLHGCSGLGSRASRLLNKTLYCWELKKGKAGLPNSNINGVVDSLASYTTLP